MWNEEARTHSSRPVADGQEVLDEERVALNVVDRRQMGVEYACHLLGRRLRFAITQPHLTTLGADHELLRQHAHTRAHAHETRSTRELQTCEKNSNTTGLFQ